MDILRFDEVSLKRSLSQLPHLRASAFAAACADRLMGNVTRLVIGRNYSPLLLNAHNLVWKSIESEGSVETVALEEGLLNAVPDEERFGSFHFSLVEDACAAMVYAMRSLHGDASRNAAWGARRAYEATDRYALGFLNASAYSDAAEGHVLRHGAVQLELARQARDIRILKDIEGGVSSLSQVKAFAAAERTLQEL